MRYLTLTYYTKADGTLTARRAKLIIDKWELPGAIAFKFALVMFVIVSSEIVGRQRDKWGRGLIYSAVGIALFPVAWSLVLLSMNGFLTRPIDPGDL